MAQLLAPAFFASWVHRNATRALKEAMFFHTDRRRQGGPRVPSRGQVSEWARVSFNARASAFVVPPSGGWRPY
jgi:hypothetical protein